MNRKQYHERMEVWNWNLFNRHRTLLCGCTIIVTTLCYLGIAQTNNGLGSAGAEGHVFCILDHIYQHCQ